uniref:Protein kinase domain-containing protein n=1 Tax=Araucaria cunninghamii TaxID=56994 RepID=A0A0D6QTC3_ARACU
MASVLSFAVFLLLVRAIPCLSDTAKPQFVEDDIKCLQTTHDGLKDPDQSLFTWRFGNTSQGFICNFVGIQCWHNDDGKVLSVKLPGMNLGGEFPSGLKYCGSMTNLDLSSNALSGEIPKDLCKWLPFLVTIDLSNNELSGPIPHELYNCTYLTVLRVNDNKLSGQIPWELTRLERLKDFNFANNMLTGQIPSAWAVNDSQFFQNNAGLCGKPLTKYCGEIRRGVNPVDVAAFALYGIVSIIWIIVAFRWWNSRQRSQGTPLALLLQSAKQSNVRARRSVKVCLFEKPIKKMILGDLLAATDNFKEDNIIWCGRTGVLYKAELPDGSLLAVKRLRRCSQSAKEFKREMNTLAHLRHRNLVPLLGYCNCNANNEDEERFLVYKYMAKGTLLNCLHGLYRDPTLDWPTRLKICIGTSRGLAWLHYSCNPHVIHRNISSGIIFLDEEYEPRISGFGLAMLVSDDDSRVNISEDEYSSANELTYDAPEQWRDIPSLATRKGDVYSFGVVVFEIITSVRPGEAMMEEEEGSLKEFTLSEWVRRNSNSNGNSERAEQAIQKFVMERRLSEQEMSLVADLMRVAFRCVRFIPDERPSMYEAYECLSKIGEKYGLSNNDEEKEIPFHMHLD